MGKTQRRKGRVAPAPVSRAFAIQAARCAAEDRADDVVVFDLNGLTSIADYFVIATGTSDRQMRAIADHIEAYARTIGERPYGVSGYETASWLLIDYVDVVIHLFTADRRSYYDLDGLWGDAPRIDWR